MSDQTGKQSQADPLIDEVRAIRRRLSEAHGNDPRRLARYLQELQKQYQERLVDYSTRCDSRKTGS
jgi:hypothetical protein